MLAFCLPSLFDISLGRLHEERGDTILGKFAFCINSGQACAVGQEGVALAAMDVVVSSTSKSARHVELPLLGLL